MSTPEQDTGAADLLIGAFAALPARDRVLLWLLVVVGDAPDRVAERLGVAPTALPHLERLARDRFAAAHHQLERRADGPA